MEREYIRSVEGVPGEAGSLWLAGDAPEYPPLSGDQAVEIARQQVANGAQISPTVNNLMVNYKIWDRPKMESWKPKKKTEEKK